MSLQLCPAPLFLSSTPFCGPSTCKHLDRGPSTVQAEYSPVTIGLTMDNPGVMPQSLGSEGTAFGATENPSTSTSPSVHSASVSTTTSLYPPPPSSASAMQMMSSDTRLGRESKRPRIASRQVGAMSAGSADLDSADEDQSMNSTGDHLDMSYSQTNDMGGQTGSSSMGIVTSAAIPNDNYPTVGASYWNGNFLSGGTMDKPNSENGETSSGLRGEGQMHGGTSQMYGTGVSWGGQDMSVSMNSMQQYVPRRMANRTWEADVQQQQAQQLHQPMQPDGSLAAPYDSPSTASNHQMFRSEYSMVDSPKHRIVPSNAYGPAGTNSGATTPLQNPGATAGWHQQGFHAGGNPAGSSNGVGSVAPMNNHRAPASTRNNRMGSASLGKDIKPKILASSTSSLPKKSPIQQSATTTRSDRAKTGDRTTHNDVERKYRTNLKDRIAELRAAVPALQAQQDGESDGTNQAAPKVSKGTVLSKATEYIQQLEQANRAMMNEHQQLVERLQTLEAMLQTSGGPRPPQFVPNHGLTLFDPRAFS